MMSMVALEPRVLVPASFASASETHYNANTEYLADGLSYNGVNPEIHQYIDGNGFVVVVPVESNVWTDGGVGSPNGSGGKVHDVVVHSVDLSSGDPNVQTLFRNIYQFL